jgi:predicted chitinase
LDKFFKKNPTVDKNPTSWGNDYEKYKKFSNIDVIENPELLVSKIENSIDAACWFWRYNGGIHKKYSAKGDVNILIKNDKYNVKLITLAVNGGSRGLKGRKKIFKKLKKEWKL